MSRVTTALREIHTALEQGTEAQKTAAMGRLLRVAEVMDNPPDDRCYHCGSSMKMYWHALTPQYRQVGNAVPPILGFKIAKELLKYL